MENEQSVLNQLFVSKEENICALNEYDKKKIKNEMKSLVSSSMFMFRLLIGMPILLCLIILVVNPSFFLPLITTDTGKLIIVLILILYTLYVIVVRKIMKVNINLLD